MKPAEIRSAEPRDAATLAALSGQLGYPSSPVDLLERLLGFQSRTDQLVLVAEREGGLLGWIHASEAHSLEAPPAVVIAGLVVAQGARGSGLGQRLVAAVARWTAEKGFRELRVRTNVVRTEAHGFYRHLGFRPLKTQTVFAMALRAGEF